MKNLKQLNFSEHEKTQDLEKKNMLSPQEKKTAYLLVEGRSAKEIAIVLCISPRTAEQYISNIKKKTNTHKKSETIMKLYQMGYRPFCFFY